MIVVPYGLIDGVSAVVARFIGRHSSRHTPYAVTLV